MGIAYTHARTFVLSISGHSYAGLEPLSQLEAFSFSTHTWHTHTHPIRQRPKPQRPSSSMRVAYTHAHTVVLSNAGHTYAGLEPLAHLEAFNFSTQTWHSPARSGSSPSPRGQPAAAANTAGTAVYLFGGWDGSTRYNDLHKLLLSGQGPDDWVWEAVVPQPAPPKGARAGITFEQQQAALQQQEGSGAPSQQQQQVQQAVQQEGLQLQVPCKRADHVMQCWHYCDDGTWKDLLVVFGGSSSEGLLNDTWLFDVNTSSWTQVRNGFSVAQCCTGVQIPF